jgi:hypothetical protein
MTLQKKSKEGAHGRLRVGEPSSGLGGVGGWESKCEISVLWVEVGRSHKKYPAHFIFHATYNGCNTTCHVS